MQQGGLRYYFLQTVLITWVSYFIVMCTKIKINAYNSVLFLEATLIDRLGSVLHYKVLLAIATEFDD